MNYMLDLRWSAHLSRSPTAGMTTGNGANCLVLKWRTEGSACGVTTGTPESAHDDRHTEVARRPQIAAIPWRSTSASATCSAKPVTDLKKCRLWSLSTSKVRSAYSALSAD